MRTNISYKECNYTIDEMSDCTTRHKLDVGKVIDFFRDNGYNVTYEAIMHNYDAWRDDMKSGYRDEENGYHLFTPCGCNPLSFRLSTLAPDCDWQETYEC